MIGGPSYREPDEGGVPCPDCSTPPPASQSAPSAGSGELPMPAIVGWHDDVARCVFLAAYRDDPEMTRYYTADQMRAYGEQCRRLATAGQGVEWQPIERAALIPVNRDGASGPHAVLLTIDIGRPGPFIRQGRFDRAVGAFVCDSTGQVLRDAIAFIAPQWAAPTPEQRG